MMFTKLKTDDEIIAMRQSGKILAHVLNSLTIEITEGMSTKDLAEIAKEELKVNGWSTNFFRILWFSRCYMYFS